jgi:ABC-2 type transport system permease protein
MILMATFAAKIKVLLSDRLFLAVSLVFPLIIASISGSALVQEKKEVILLAVVDEDNSAYSRELVGYLHQRAGFQIFDTERAKAEKLLDENRTEAVVVILNGFSDHVMGDDLDGILELTVSSTSFSRTFLGELIASDVIHIWSGEFAAFQAKRTARQHDRLFSENDRIHVMNIYEDEIKYGASMDVIYRTIDAKPPSYSGSANYPPTAAASMGLLVLFLFFGSLFGSGWLSEERCNGTLNRIISATGASLQVFVGNLAALSAVCVLQSVLYLGLTQVLFGVSPARGALSAVILGVYILCVVTMSMTLASFFKTAAQLQAATPLIALVTGFAGGCLWNQVGFVGNLPVISRCTPQGWALQGLGRLYANPFDLAGILLPISVLGIASALFFSMAWLKWRIDRNE